LRHLRKSLALLESLAILVRLSRFASLDIHQRIREMLLQTRHGGETREDIGQLTMNFTAKRVIATFLLLLSLAAAAPAGPLEDGNAAYKRGDYATAMRILRPLADQGNGMAETIVGSMYYFNHGVPLDWVSAYMWFSLATANGNSLGASFLKQMTLTMTQREIAEAQQRAREWKPTQPPQ
jgi:TPR repeat protein